MRFFGRNLLFQPVALVSFSLPCVGNVNLGECISGIYTWSLTLVGLAAFLSIVYGGVMVVFAFGNTGKVSEATKRITNGVLGIILLFSSYLILRTINPDLVGGGIRLPKITKEDQIKNTGGENDLTKIERFEVKPSTGTVVDLSDDTELLFTLRIYGSTANIAKLCGPGNIDRDWALGDLSYVVYYEPGDVAIRSDSFGRNEFGTGDKVISKDFKQRVKYDNDAVRAGQAGYKAVFRCRKSSSTIWTWTVLNTSTIFPVKIVP